MARENYKFVKGKKIPRAVKYELPYHSSHEQTASVHYSETEVCVANLDTLAAVLQLHKLALGSACAHNFANALHPGGGYLKGSLAQEEDLCRSCPDLYGSLHRTHYPIRRWEALLSKSIAMERDPESMKLEGTLCQCDVVSNALPDLGRPRAWPRPEDPKWHDVVRTSIRATLHAAKQSGCPNLVTGAFGCGAFRNPPQKVVEIFKEVLEANEFRGAFRRIIFAIVDTNGKGNIKPFAEHLQFLN